MSLLPKNLGFDRIGIRRIKDFIVLRRWLDKFVMQLIKAQREDRDAVEAGGAGTAKWKMKDANAADVAAGRAVKVGNLIFVHRATNVSKGIEIEQP